MASPDPEEAQSISRYPLYGASFTLHRLSPLYHGQESESLLSDTALSTHARRFHDLLKGEVLRGVRVALDAEHDDGLRKAGSLSACTWTVLGDEASWQERQTGDDATLPLSKEDARGIHIQVSYERKTYTAILLRDPDLFSLSEADGFTHLPLLLTRMPSSLRDTFLDYLATTFDTRFSPLKLDSSFLESTFEIFLLHVTRASVETDGLPRQSVLDALRDIQLTLAFTAPVAPSLRSLDIIVPSSEVISFMEKGSTTQTDDETRDGEDTGTWGKERSQGSFMKALTHHIASNLALPISHSQIKVSKIGCGVVLMGAEGRFKTSRRSEHLDRSDPINVAVNEVIANLIKRAKGTPMLGENFG